MIVARPKCGPVLARLLAVACLAASLAPAPATADSPPPFGSLWSLGFIAASGIGVDPSTGEVYVSNYNGAQIHKYSASGAFITAWGNLFLKNPLGVAVDGSGNVFISDNGHSSIRKTTGTGGLLTTWPAGTPSGCAVDSAGNVYVVNGDAVFKYDNVGTFITSWGTTGSGNGQFTAPFGVAVDRSGNVYVADTGNHRIQKFTSTGTYLAQWGSNGSGNGQFSSPWGVAADRYGHVLVADTGNNRVQAFTSSGVFLSTWGTLGNLSGQFNAPRALATSTSGLIYVLDTGNSRVQLFGAVCTAALLSAPNPSVTGQTITLTATVTPAPLATPQVTFFDGVTSIGNAQLMAGTGILNVAISGVGPHSLTVQFAGDAMHSACTSPAITQTVNQGASAVAVSANVNPAGAGQPVTFSATVTAQAPGAGTPGGTVTFLDGVTTLGSGSLSAGVATFSTAALTVGSHSITASYGGDANFTGSVSSPISQNVIANTAPPAYATQFGTAGSGLGQYNHPRGVALNPSTDTYVVDHDNHRIQYYKQFAGSLQGQWGTLGSGNGQFNGPTGVAIDASAVVYVTDTGNNRVQRFSSLGLFQGVVGGPGSGNGQFQAPAGIAINGGPMYVVDTGNNRVEKFIMGAYVSQWGTTGSGNGQFSSPTGIAIAASGDVYVTDTGNHRVQKFTSAGVYVTQWGGSGSGNGQFSSPAGVAVDGAGSVYVADAGNNRVQKFSPAGTYLSQWGTAGSGNGQFQSPWGLLVNALGTVLVSDQNNHRLQTFGLATSTVLLSGLNPSVFGQTVTLTATVTPSISGGSVTFYDGATPLDGGALSGGTASVFVSSLTVGAHSLTAVYGGNADYAGSTSAPITQNVNKATPAFLLTTDPYPSGVGQAVTITATLGAMFPGSGTPGGSVTFKDGVTTIGAGALVSGVASLTAVLAAAGSHSLTVVYAGDASFLAGTSPPFVHLVSPLDLAPSFVLQWGSAGSGDTQFGLPVDVAVDGSRNVYVCDQANARIQKFNASGAYLTQWGTSGMMGNGDFLNPSGVALNAAGEVYVCDTGDHRIQKFSGTGTYLAQWGTFGSGDGQFQSPADLAIDDAGVLYVCDTGNHRIQKFSATGTYLGQWGSQGSGDGQLQSPGAIAVDAAGKVYVCDTGNHRLEIFATDGTFLKTWGTSGSGNGQFTAPAGVVVELAGNVYVSDTGNHRIEKFGPAGTYLAQWGTLGAAAGQFSSPAGLAVDAQGAVIVADAGNHRVQKFRRPARITSVADVGNDQGHQVRVRFLADAADVASSAVPIVRYDLFRRINGGQQARVEPVAALAPAATPPGPARIEVDGWDFVGTLSAYTDPAYNLVVPTLADSNGNGAHASAFFVRAATATPSVFFDSPADSGWSVDNLPPAPPAPFTAAYASGATHLHWGRNTEPDLWYYRLYRGSSAGFVPDPSNLIASPADTGYADAGAAGSTYKLSAVDVAGNESPYAVLTPTGTTAVDDGPIVFALAVESPARNGRLTARVALPSAAAATLELFDVSGRKLAGREVGSFGPGRRTLDPAGGRRLAPGLYLVRLEQGASRRVVRAVILD